LITRRCIHRQFLLRPDEATNNAFLYCLMHAALRCRRRRSVAPRSRHLRAELPGPQKS